MKTISGIWHYTSRNQSMSWSPAMFELFMNKEPTPYSLSKIHQMIHTLDRFKWEIAVNQATLGGPPSEFECRLWLDSVESIWIKNKVQAVIENGVAVGLEGICSDITELKIREMEIKFSSVLFK